LCDDLLFINGAYAEYVRVPERVVRTNLLVVPDAVPAAVACMTEPLACVLNGLDAVRFGPGDTIVVNGDGPSGLMMAAMARQRGARVIVCGRASQRLTLAKQFGAEVVINYAQVSDQVEAVRTHTEGHRGVEVAIEAVGRPEVWEASVAMARKGGQVLFYGGCPGGSVVQLPTGPLHYDQLTLLGVFHNTPYHVRLALSLLSENIWPWASLITHELALNKLHEAFELMMSRKALKVAILP
jgi:L-iditol 2-dehydrogenase